MSALVELIQLEAADSSISFRERLYRRDEHRELLRDLVALANAAVVGPRYLFLGVEDKPGRARKFSGVAEASWKKFCAALPPFLERAVEPKLQISLESVRVGEVLVGVVCLARCEDPPYLLARRVASDMPAGGGWIRRGTRQTRLLRRHFQRIFEARFRRQELGDVCVGFPGRLPREEVMLPPLPLDALPSALAAHRIQRMIDAKCMSRSVLGRSDTRIARLVHAQVSDTVEPYQHQGTQTMRILLSQVPAEHAAADNYYQFEMRAHHLQLQLNNLSDEVQRNLVLTLTVPRVEGIEVAEKLYAPPGVPEPRAAGYPTVDLGPRTIAVQSQGLSIPARGSIQAFFEPLRLALRESLLGQTIRLAYTLRGGTLARPLRGRLKILVAEV